MQILNIAIDYMNAHANDGSLGFINIYILRMAFKGWVGYSPLQ